MYVEKENNYHHSTSCSSPANTIECVLLSLCRVKDELGMRVQELEDELERYCIILYTIYH